MKNILIFTALLLGALSLQGQTNLPTYGYNYQAVIRNASGAITDSTPVQLRFRILTATDQNLYEETHTTTTDAFGRVALVIGTGTPAGPAKFDTLNWAARKHFLDVAVKIGGATTWAGLGKEEVVHQPLAKGSRDWKNVGDTVLISDGKRIGIGINNPKHDLSVAKGAAFGSRILPGLNGTENGFSLVHFKNGTDNQGGIIRASKGDEDVASAPLLYQGERHVFQGGNMVIEKPNPSLTFLNNNGKAYYWESSGGVFYLYDPSLAKYRLFFHDNGKVGIGTNNPEADLDVNGTTRTKSLEITGGDLAEARHGAGGAALLPGMVVVFDEIEQGKVRPTDRPYDKKVAGVISGAGKYFAGVCLLQEELARGAAPVAQVGSVEVWCVGPVEVGDLLTTSEVPGHAMAISDPLRGIGCTIGKAVTALKAGERGLVEMQVEKH